MIRDPETGWTEATVVINGRSLTFGEAMTLRVAVGAYLMWLEGGAKNELGPVGRGYEEACRRLIDFIHRGGTA